MRYAAQKVARNKANADFLAKEAEKVMEQEATKKALERAARYKSIGKAEIVIVGIAATGYCIYKVIPKIKKELTSRKERIAKD